MLRQLDSRMVSTRHFVPRSGASMEANTPSVDLLVDGERYFERWFEVVERVGSAALAGSDASLSIRAYRFSPHLTAQGSEGAENALLAVARATEAGASVSVGLSPHLGRLANAGAALALRRRGLDFEWLEGSARRASHEKLTFASCEDRLTMFVGSLDPWVPRWDSSQHNCFDERRFGRRIAPSHDVGLMLEVGHPNIDVTTAEPEDLMDAFRAPNVRPMLRNKNDPDCLIENIVEQIGSAESYIYIEDQYFLPSPDLGARGRLLQEVLRDRLAHGVHLFVVLPGPSSPVAPRQAIESRSAHYVESLLRGLPDNAGSVRIYGRQSGGGATARRQIYVHSKVLITDSKSATIGSANFTRRSLTFDTEAAVRVDDPTWVGFAQDQLIADLCQQSTAESTDASIERLHEPPRGAVELTTRPAYRLWQIGERVFRHLADPGE